MKILKFSVMAALFSILFLSANSQEKDLNKIKNSTEVLSEFSKMKEHIPEKLFNVTEGIVIVPHMINAGMVVTGERGKGIAVVKNEDGTWSNPVFFYYA
jgi:lipid-binding SYLF domain-containing protein